MLRQLSYEEVELHDNEHDCWVILGPSGFKKVYDLTAFLDDHPGGAELLLDLAGMDVQDEFEDIGHSAAAREMLQVLCIGELKADREEQVRRDARKYERRSLLLMQSPVMDKLYADNRERRQQPRIPLHQQRCRWLHSGSNAQRSVALYGAMFVIFIGMLWANDALSVSYDMKLQF
uniref:Cytochrome b5 heme-binding domain-containing protein n=1 Tax=Globisporangium ultimum (strain ATCC 200006 / CBS 805.95 / DAOM BR144) TaxID=431595 RepID=K3X3P0_GLOUD